MNNENWLSTNFDPSMLDMVPVKIRTKMGVEATAILSVEKSDLKEGKIIVSASYNSSPFPNIVTHEVFFLTQEQLDEFQEKGSNCVLSAPSKNRN